MISNNSSIRTIALIGLLGFVIPAGILSPIFAFMADQALLANDQPEVRYVIFDLGGVLLQASKMSALGHLGWGKVLRYSITGHSPKALKRKLFEIIDLIEPLHTNAPRAYTPDGSRLLPQLFQDWLAGTYSSKKIRETVLTFINEHPQLFVSKTEQTLVKATTRMIFTPEIFADIMRPVKEGINLVRQCKKQGLHVLILSNFDEQTFQHLYNQYPTLFSESMDIVPI